MFTKRFIPPAEPEPVRNWFEPVELGPISEDDKARFFEKVGEPDVNGCRRWLAAYDAYGYGAFVLNGRAVKASRVAKAIAIGHDIPPRQRALHLCDRPYCVEPSHIVLGSMQDNTNHMIARGRDVIFGDYNATLTDEQVREVYQLLAENKLTQFEIAARFGVSAEAISHINHRKTWKELAPEGWQPADGVWAKGERVGTSKLKEHEVRQIYSLAWQGHYTLQEIGEMFGVSKRAVLWIKQRKNWKHLWLEAAE